MRLLLDECVPGPLRKEFSEYEVFTVEQVGLKGLRNRALLRAASMDFDVLIRVDKGLEFQHNLKRLPIAIILISVRSNKLEVLKSLIPDVPAAMESISPREFIKIEF